MQIIVQTLHWLEYATTRCLRSSARLSLQIPYPRKKAQRFYFN